MGLLIHFISLSLPCYSYVPILLTSFPLSYVTTGFLGLKDRQKAGSRPSWKPFTLDSILLNKSRMLAFYPIQNISSCNKICTAYPHTYIFLPYCHSSQCETSRFNKPIIIWPDFLTTSRKHPQTQCIFLVCCSSEYVSMQSNHYSCSTTLMNTLFIIQAGHCFCLCGNSKTKWS